MSTSLVKWAAATVASAMMAVPALAAHASHKHLASGTHKIHNLVASNHKTHSLHAKSSRLSSHSRKAKSLSATKHGLKHHHRRTATQLSTHKHKIAN